MKEIILNQSKSSQDNDEDLGVICATNVFMTFSLLVKLVTYILE
jgi:hypothetical protein